MMPHFMGNHVCVGEITTGTDVGFHFLEEVKVDVYGAVCRAVEGSDLRCLVAAGRLHRAVEQHHFRRLVFSPALFAECARPYILSTGEHC